MLNVFAIFKRKHVGSGACLIESSLPPCPQPFLPRECLQLGRARRAPRPCMMKAPQTRTRTMASTTPQWTGGSLCATPGTWSRLSGQLCSTAPQTFGVLAGAHTFNVTESNWVTMLNCEKGSFKTSWGENRKENYFGTVSIHDFVATAGLNSDPGTKQTNPHIQGCHASLYKTSFRKKKIQATQIKLKYFFHTELKLIYSEEQTWKFRMLEAKPLALQRGNFFRAQRPCQGIKAKSEKNIVKLSVN